MQHIGKLMKILSAGLVFLSSFLVSSCGLTPVEVPMPSYGIKTQSEKRLNLAVIEVKPEWVQASLTNNAGIHGLNAVIKNNTNQILRIHWDKSSISYNNSSHTIFLSGQKFIDATKPVPATVIPANGTDSKSLFSSQQPFYATAGFVGWRIVPIQAKKITLVLCVAAGDREDYYTIEVNEKN
jgi:hypothetical protein